MHIVDPRAQIARVAVLRQRADHLVARPAVLDRQHVRCGWERGTRVRVSDRALHEKGALNPKALAAMRTRPPPPALR